MFNYGGDVKRGGIYVLSLGNRLLKLFVVVVKGDGNISVVNAFCIKTSDVSLMVTVRVWREHTKF